MSVASWLGTGSSASSLAGLGLQCARAGTWSGLTTKMVQYCLRGVGYISGALNGARLDAKLASPSLLFSPQSQPRILGIAIHGIQRFSVEAVHTH